MKSNKGKGLLGLLGLLVVLGIFGFFGYDTLQKSKLVTDENGVTSQNGGIKLGLDLAGGVSITYQAKEENPSAEDMSDTQYKLQQRVQNYSSEAEVYQEGGNRINVDIPVSQTRTRSWKSSVSRDPCSSMMRTGMLYWKEPM